MIISYEYNWSILMRLSEEFLSYFESIEDLLITDHNLRHKLEGIDLALANIPWNRKYRPHQN